MTPVIELRGAGRTFRGGHRVVAVDQGSLSVWPGQFVAVTGPSGSGKSTLLSLPPGGLAGVLPGVVGYLVAGYPVQPRDLATALRPVTGRRFDNGVEDVGSDIGRQVRIVDAVGDETQHRVDVGPVEGGERLRSVNGLGRPMAAPGVVASPLLGSQPARRYYATVANPPRLGIGMLVRSGGPG